MMLAKELLLSYYKTQCLYAISELKIADQLESGPKSAETLANNTSTHPPKLYRIMRFLAAEGLFNESDDGFFELNDQSTPLLAASDYSLRQFIRLHATCFYQSATDILTSLKQDESAFEIKFQLPAHHYFITHDEIGNTYNTAMSENSRYFSRLLLENYDFSPYKTITDIGGGLGTLMLGILETYSRAHGIVFDLPHIKEQAESLIQSHKLGDRCHYVSGSFFETIPKHADLYILKAILHGKDDDAAIKILGNIKNAANKTSKILIIDRIIDKEKDYPQSCINDINMLSVTRGFDRTLAQYRKLLEDVELQLKTIYYLDDAHYIIEIST